MKTQSAKFILSPIAGAVLVLGLSVSAAHAQTTPKAAAPTTDATPPSNAQLQQELEALREQVRQLQQAQHGSTSAQRQTPPAAAPGKAKDGMAMGKQKDKAMQKGGGMGMMDCMDKMGCMDKMDDAMEMPPADPAKPDPMPGGMSDM